MDEKLLKDFIKNNLLIDVDLDDKSGEGNSVTIGLKFAGDEYSFCTESIYIPDEI